jgi:hypothetical protein
MAFDQPGKIQPILHLSVPKGRPPKDDLNPAKIAKSDCDNTYKIIPVHFSACRLHGFSWNQEYFVDTSSTWVQNRLLPILIV